jgi:hypothetical protein
MVLFCLTEVAYHKCLSQVLISNAYPKKISNHGKFCPNSFVTIQPNYHRGLRSC